MFLFDQLERNRIDLLNITVAHTIRTASLPFHHRDPFDRMLIAQSLTESIPIVSGDAVFDLYGVIRLWEPNQLPLEEEMPDKESE
jgi:PIN domain nuclease of toxin-antitoxin system